MLLDPSSRLRTLLIEHQQSVIEDCGALLYARAVTLVGRQTARQLVEQIVSAVHNHLLALLEREVDICDLAYQLNTDDFSTTLAQWSGPQGLGLVPGETIGYPFPVENSAHRLWRAVVGNR
jgi:hypothetical protein